MTSKGLDPDYLLHFAIAKNQPSIVESLIQQKQNVNFYEPTTGYTPLHSAACQGYYDIALTLIESGAQIDVENLDGETPLHLACHAASLQLVLFLVAKGADVNHVDKQGRTPLMLAASNRNSYDLIRVLIKLGADVNTCDKLDRSTALHYAVRSDNSAAIAYLVKIGNASTTVANSKGETPLKLACLSNDLALMRRTLSKVLWYNSKTFATILLRTIPFVYIGFMGVIPSLCPNLLVTIISGLSFTLLTCLTLFYYIPVVYPRQPAMPSLMLAYLFYLHVSNFTHNIPEAISPSPFIILYIVSSVSVPIFLYKMVIGDPGYIIRRREDNLADIARKCEGREFRMSELCTTCIQFRPLRSKHCRTCDKCVARFDHHCPWTDNCLGVRNHKFFWFFLANGLIGLTPIIYDGFSYFYKVCDEDYRQATFVIPVFKFWYAYNCSPWSAWMGSLLTMFYVWMLFMFCLHTYTVILKGSTTNEIINKDKYSRMRPNFEKERKFYDKGILQNLSDFTGFDLFNIHTEDYNYTTFKPRDIDWYKIETVPEGNE